jgi:hypothetical protein
MRGNRPRCSSVKPPRLSTSYRRSIIGRSLPKNLFALPCDRDRSRFDVKEIREPTLAFFCYLLFFLGCYWSFCPGDPLP